MDPLSPESRVLYDILMADTAEIYESKFAAYRKDRLDAVKQFADDTRMRIKELQPTVVSVQGKEEIEVDSVKAALGEDLAAVKSAPCPEISAPAPATVVPASATTRSTTSLHATSCVVSTTTPAAAASAVTKDDLSPGARRIYDLLIGGSVAPDSSTSLRPSSSAIPTSDHKTAAATSTPASALDVSCAQWTSDAIYTREATATCVSTEMPLDSTPTIVLVAAARQETADLRLMAPSASSMLDLDDNNDGEDPVATSSTQLSAPPSSNAPPDVLPRPLSAAMGVLEFFILSPSTCSNHCSCHNFELLSTIPSETSKEVNVIPSQTTFLPWPPPSWTRTGTTSDVFVPHAPGITFVSITPCSMGCTNGAGASLSCNDTDGDGVQPIIYNSEGVDLAIVTVPRDMMLAAASTVAASMLNTDLVVVTSPNGSSNSQRPHWDPGAMMCGLCTKFQGELEQKWMVSFVEQLAIAMFPSMPSATHNHFPSGNLMQFGVLSLHTRIKWPPWSICIQNMQKLDLLDVSFRLKTTLLPLVVESLECIWSRIEIRCFSSQVTGIFLFHSVACSIPNLHCTRDGKQLSGDRLFFPAMELQWNATLTVITFDHGVQRIQLQPLFECSDRFCHDTHYPFASATVNMMLDLLLAWVVLNSHFATVHIQWKNAVQVYTSSSEVSRYPSSNIFLAIFNGDAEVQIYCSCTRILTDALCQGWNHRQVHRGNTHYSELMPCSVSDSLLQSRLEFHITGHILFYCCALVRWNQTWTISLVSLQSWFQCCCAGRESLYSLGNFQWTIAWFLVGSFGADSDSVCNDAAAIIFWVHLNLGMIPPLHCKDPIVDQIMTSIGHIIHCGFERTQWNIAWSSLWGYLEVDNQFRQFILAATLTYPVWYFSWDPSIWALLCFCGVFVQVVAKGGNMVATPTYYNINLVPVLPNHIYDINRGYKHDSGKIDETHVTWDPGGSTWLRLGVKPNFKGWGLSTTCLHGLTNGPTSWAIACLGPRYGGGRCIYTSRAATRRGGLEPDGKGGFGRGACSVECVSGFIFFL